MKTNHSVSTPERVETSSKIVVDHFFFFLKQLQKIAQETELEST